MTDYSLCMPTTRVASPGTSFVGDTAIRQAAKDRSFPAGKALCAKILMFDLQSLLLICVFLSRTFTPALPPTVKVAVYLQEPFTCSPDFTWAWGLGSTNPGDIRKCPSTHFLSSNNDLFSQSYIVFRRPGSFVSLRKHAHCLYLFYRRIKVVLVYSSPVRWTVSKERCLVQRKGYTLALEVWLKKETL